MPQPRTEDTFQLKKLSNMHEMIVLFLLENPMLEMQEVAAHFQVTPGYLSTIVNCDLFQARIAEYRVRGFEINVMSIHEKMAAAASLALERLTTKLGNEERTEVLLDAANKLTQRLGHGGSPALQLNVQDNSVTVQASKESLAEARDIVKQVKRALAPLTGESDDAPPARNVIDVTPTETAEVGPSTT